MHPEAKIHTLRLHWDGVPCTLQGHGKGGCTQSLGNRYTSRNSLSKTNSGRELLRDRHWLALALAQRGSNVSFQQLLGVPVLLPSPYSR